MVRKPSSQCLSFYLWHLSVFLLTFYSPPQPHTHHTHIFSPPSPIVLDCLHESAAHLKTAFSVLKLSTAHKNAPFFILSSSHFHSGSFCTPKTFYSLPFEIFAFQPSKISANRRAKNEADSENSLPIRIYSSSQRLLLMIIS